jgi:hypothetical protein
MFGKIKEKLDSYSLMECLEHYQRSYESLEASGVVHPKRLTYKNKSSSFESNEVFYRIYALTLKRLSTSTSDLTSLLAFLERVVNEKFVKIHFDFQLEEISSFLNESVFAKSNQIALIEPEQSRATFCKCVCICVAGLSQILKRFSQHYRSLYRLAHFYANFVDFSQYDISRNLIMGTVNWQHLVYMPCPGLFHERNKTNFFNGIWRISNTDFEREGSFFHHLSECVRLLIDILVRRKETSSLIELSKSLHQRAEQDRKYLENSSREHFAYLSADKALQLLDEVSQSKFKTSFDDVNELTLYQNDLVPILLDTYEVYKLAAKSNIISSSSNSNSESQEHKNVEHLLLKLYIQFHPSSVNRLTSITIEEMIKYCQFLERKDKPSKTKSKPKIQVSGSVVA